jgi:hypothetical protein
MPSTAQPATPLLEDGDDRYDRQEPDQQRSRAAPGRQVGPKGHADPISEQGEKPRAAPGSTRAPRSPSTRVTAAGCSRLALLTAEQNFWGMADHRSVDDAVAVTLVRSRANRAERTSRLIAASSDDDVIFSLQLKGVANASQQGRTAQVPAERGVLYTTGLPHSSDVTNGNESLAIQVPRERLGLSRGLTGRLCARPSIGRSRGSGFSVDTPPRSSRSSTVPATATDDALT